MLQQMIYVNRAIDLSDDALAFEAIKEVGPGSHFFGAEHTQRRFKDAFYSPFLSDWRNYESWEEAGSMTTEKRANAIMKDIWQNLIHRLWIRPFMMNYWILSIGERLKAAL